MTMQAAKLHKWSSAFPSTEAVLVGKRAWQLGLQQAGLTEEMVSFGLKKAIRKEGFAPDLAEFIKMCKPEPEDFNLPSPVNAYLEAAKHCHEWNKHTFSHAVVLKTLLETGIAVIREFPRSKSEKVFLRNYAIVINRFLKGEKMERMIPKALPEEIPVQLSTEQKKARLKQMREDTGL